MMHSSTLSKSVLALSLACACVPGYALSVAGFLHLHPHAAPVSDDRAHLVLKNPRPTFHDVMVDGKVYTVGSHKALTITAPVGTRIYAADKMFRKHAQGDVVAQVERGESTILLD